MLKSCWKDSLQKKIKELRRVHSCPRIALVGIGQELCGDDAVGVLAARALQKKVEYMSNLLVIEAGPAPENFCGELRRFQPHLVLFIDAAQMNGEPGLINYLDPNDTIGMGFSTHSLPLYFFADYLCSELGCEAGILGIQPGNIAFGAPLTPAVQNSTANLISNLDELLTLPAAYQRDVGKYRAGENVSRNGSSRNARGVTFFTNQEKGAFGK